MTIHTGAPLESSPTQSSNFDKFVSTLARTLPEFERDKILQIAEKAIQSQQQLRASSSVTIALVEPLHGIPKSFAVTPDSFSIIHEQIGSGSNSNVRRATTIPTERTTFGGSMKPISPSKALDTVLKRTILPAPSHSPIKKSVDASIAAAKERINGAGSEKREREGCENTTGPKRQRTLGVARILITANDDMKHSYNISKRRDNDAYSIDYSKLTHPIKGALTVLSDASTGLGVFHATGKSHKDVKGQNILYEMDGVHAIRKGFLDDHERLTIVPEKETKTYVSYFYVDSSTFETGANNLVKQKARMGIQSLEGDIYALGVTICYDFILNIAKCLASKDIEKQTLLKKLIIELNPKRPYGSFTEDNLKKIALMGPQTVYVGATKLESRESLLINPPPEKLVLSLNALCDLIRDDLSSEAEYHALKALGELSCEMRAANPSERPKIEQVKQRLDEIIQEYESSSERTNLGVPTSSSSPSCSTDVFTSITP